MRRAPHGRPVVVTGHDRTTEPLALQVPGADRVARPATAALLWKEATTWANRSATSRQSSELVLRHERLLIFCTTAADNTGGGPHFGSGLTIDTAAELYGKKA